MDSSYDSLRLFNNAKRLVNLGALGIAIYTSEDHPELIGMLQHRKVCAVCADREKPEPYVSSVNFDFAFGIRQAVEHLQELGHENIGYISAFSSLPTLQLRRQTFIDSLANGSAASRNIIETEPSVQGGYFACGKLLTNAAPTAIICVCDTIAIGALHYAADHGIHVPDQLSLIGGADIQFSQYMRPELTSIEFTTFETGRLMFQTLRELDQNRTMGKIVEIKPRLIVRQSTACVPALAIPGK